MSSQPTCALLLIGNELLSGRTADANMPFFAAKMAEKGIRFAEARVVPDEEAEIVAALNALCRKYTYVFTTGGIGPTHDDITMACIAKAFGVGIARSAKVEAAFRAAHPGRSEEVMQTTLKMADFPVGAELIENDITLAPGFRLENVYALAGVPKIMQAMLTKVLPTLPNGPAIHSRSVEAFITESELGKPLAALQQIYSATDIGSYPRREEGRAKVGLVVRGTDKAQVEAAYEEMLKMLHTLNAQGITAL